MERFLTTKFSLWVIAVALIQMHRCKGCLEEERISLLEIKSFFKSFSDMKYSDNILNSWVEDRMSDCCRWEEVKCSPTSGRVIKLLLNSTRKFQFGTTNDRVHILNFSLFHPFQELQSLDLSKNFFEGFVESKDYDSFGSLKQLKYLNLGFSNFTDSILLCVTALTSLTTLILHDNKIVEGFKYKAKQSMSPRLANLKDLEMLDLSANSISSSITTQGICELRGLVELKLSGNKFYGPIPQCLSNLTNLRVLDLSSNKLSGNLSSLISNLTSLEYLSLSDNNFHGLFSFRSLANLSKLQVFQLSTENNSLQVDTETFAWPPTYQLKALYLRNCNLQAIPRFLLYQYELRVIDLSHNKLAGTFPTWLLHNNTKLEVLYLMNNSFTGILQLPNSKHDLLRLQISYNNFHGELPENIGMIFPKLSYVDMSENSFQGNIPFSICEMERLDLLDLSRNNFSGELTEHFVTGCFSLTFLDLSHNNFHGKIVSELFNLTKLERLYLYHNLFSGKISDGPYKATSLFLLDISNNMITGRIPLWIGNFSSLTVLAMSKNLLEGNIPFELNNLRSLRYLDISENKLSGSTASSLNLSLVQHLYLQKNALRGSIPNALLESSSLITLDLRDNALSGRVPNLISEYSNLHFLLLRGNNLRGYIPNQLCQLKTLCILDLSYNKLNGSIPSCFTDISLLMRGGEGYAYKFLPENSRYQVFESFDTYYNSSLIVSRWEEIYSKADDRAVEFTTKNRYESYKGDILKYMTGFDFSSNELTGDIPSQIGHLQNIRAVNFSHNFLSGSIPDSFSNLKMIESLDLSYNKLSGEIPPQLTELNYLAIFNVSYNYLSGPTPNQGQFANYDESNYNGNPGLCGSTIHKSCSKTPAKPSTGAAEEEDESAIDMVTFYWSFAAAYITIMLGIFVILWLNAHWRNQWFRFIDECICSYLYWLLK